MLEIWLGVLVGLVLGWCTRSVHWAVTDRDLDTPANGRLASTKELLDGRRTPRAD